MSEAGAIAAVVAARPDLEIRNERLRVASVDGFPEFDYVTFTDEDGRPMIGGTTFVVADDGQVFECSGSLSPRANCIGVRNQRTGQSTL